MEDGQRQNGKLRETEGEWETDRNSTGDGQRKNGKLRETDGQMGDGQKQHGRRTASEWKADEDRMES